MAHGTALSMTERSNPNLVSSSDAARLMRLATYASVSVALVLIGVKLLAWIDTGSVAMLSSLVDSGIDAIASFLNLLAVRHALTPADREHRFGHGKAEALSGLGQAAFIFASALFLGVEATDRLINPQPIEDIGFGITVMVVSIIVTGALVTFQRYVMRRARSVAVGADSLHYVGDLLSNLAVIAALLLASGLGLLWADGLLALIVAGILLKSSWSIARQSFDHLMDREFPEDDRQRIRAIALGHPEAQAMHDLRTRMSGQRAFIQFHLELDPDMRLSRAHEISDAIEARILEAFPGAEVIIHQDPAGLKEKRPDFAHT